MNSNNAAASRPNGVVLPPHQRTAGQGAPRSLSGFMEAKTYAVEYVDDNGDKHITLAMLVGGQWYLPPNGENYAATLRPINKDTWLAKQLDERLLSQGAAPNAPKTDAVDVIG